MNIKDFYIPMIMRNGQWDLKHFPESTFSKYNV